MNPSRDLTLLNGGFWLGGGLGILLLLALGVSLAQGDPAAADSDWLPFALVVLATLAFLLCVGCRVARRIVLERARRESKA